MYGIIFERRSRNAKPRAKQAIGRVMKIAKLPPEIMRDRRRDCSSIGPNTKARTRGAASYANFLIR
jgi:hypothetical protein